MHQRAPRAVGGADGRRCDLDRRFECAGHPGEDDTPGLILIPVAADKVKIPMIASGGFGDGRGLVAALALGAEGINMGTRFMCTKESPIHQQIKEKIVANDERETELIFRTMRNTSRVARNAISTKVVAMEKEGAKFEQVRDLVAGARGKMVYSTGNADEGIWSAGQVQGLIHDIPTCAELMSRIMRDAEAIIQSRFGAMMSGGRRKPRNNPSLASEPCDEAFQTFFDALDCFLRDSSQ